ncbi:MAG: hypothetical protein HWE27_17550 [Gammaproteobacteria bacterium]|nr:hypothetical protein [Gammaproteobacteria bacterium]
MMIHPDKCKELGLSKPKNHDNQLAYVKRIILNGIKFNTRLARYVGIHNLHSIISILFKKGVQFTLEHGKVWCPFKEEVPPYPVDIIYMTEEQVLKYKEEKAAKKD